MAIVRRGKTKRNVCLFLKGFLVCNKELTLLKMYWLVTARAPLGRSSSFIRTTLLHGLTSTLLGTVGSPPITSPSNKL